PRRARALCAPRPKAPRASLGRRAPPSCARPRCNGARPCGFLHLRCVAAYRFPPRGLIDRRICLLSKFHTTVSAVQPLSAVLTVVATTLGLLAALHALLNKRRPQAALGWIAVSLTLPFIGALLYYLFGINRVESRARLLRGTAVSKAPLAPEAE